MGSGNLPRGSATSSGSSGHGAAATLVDCVAPRPAFALDGAGIEILVLIGAERPGVAIHFGSALEHVDVGRHSLRGAAHVVIGVVEIDLDRAAVVESLPSEQAGLLPPAQDVSEYHDGVGAAGGESELAAGPGG